MRRAFALCSLCLLAANCVNYGYSEEWRSVRQVQETREVVRSAERSSTVIKPGTPVRLGKPVARQGSEAAREGDIVQVSYAPLKLAAPRPIGTVVRAQGGDAHPPLPSGSEEYYNSGVVTEGPAYGESIFAGPKRWFHNLFSGSKFGYSPPLYGFNGTRGSFESDHAFDSFISPVSNPFFFEDPRSLTEVRFNVIYQKIPGDNLFFGGGDIEFFNLQARLALTERWSIILPKLGYVVMQPDLAPNESGFSELMIGTKYTFWRDDMTNTIAAVGVNFELPIGDNDVFQDTGDGGVTPFITAGQKVGNFHFLGTFGYRFSFDSNRSESLFTSLHADYSFFDRIYPLVEMNWYHYTKSGNNPLTHGFEGQDIANLGSTGVAGNDVVTLAAGVRFKITESVQAGIVYEFPLTKREDLLDYRITADVIIRY